MPDEDLEFHLSSPEYHERLAKQAALHGFGSDVDGMAGKILEAALDSMPIPLGAWMGRDAGQGAQRATVRFSLVADADTMEDVLRD